LEQAKAVQQESRAGRRIDLCGGTAVGQQQLVIRWLWRGRRWLVSTSSRWCCRYDNATRRSWSRTKSAGGCFEVAVERVGKYKGGCWCRTMVLSKVVKWRRLLSRGWGCCQCETVGGQRSARYRLCEGGLWGDYCRIQAGCFTALRGARAKTRLNNGARDHSSIITVCVENCAASGGEGHIAQHENHPAKLLQRDVDRSRGEETRGDEWHWRLAPPASSEACPARPCLEDAL